jgi:hypothetical protein
MKENWKQRVPRNMTDPNLYLHYNFVFSHSRTPEINCHNNHSFQCTLTLTNPRSEKVWRGSTVRQSRWEMWTKWHLHRCFPSSSCFPTSVFIYDTLYFQSTPSTAMNYTQYGQSVAKYTTKRKIVYFKLHVHPKRRYVFTRAHGIFQNTVFINSEVL